MKELLKAIEYAHGMWRIQARFTGVKVNSVTALGTPGCLEGPRLASLITSAPTVVAMKGQDATVRDAVAKGVSGCFADWQSLVTVPGLPWYPAFAAWAAPQAPPMPNVPTTLMACVSSRVQKIVRASSLKKAMERTLPKDAKNDAAMATISGIATVLAVHFNLWLARQQVTNVLGYGPVPTYAPPAVPAGPVVNGSIISTPGHLLAGTLPRLAKT